MADEANKQGADGAGAPPPDPTETGLTFFERAQLVLSFATLLTAIGSLIYLGAQLGGLNETIESQSYSYVIEGLAEYDRILVERPELMPYLEGGPDGSEVRLPANSGQRLRVLALANYKLDFIDGFYSQERHIRWDQDYTRAAWDDYFRDSFVRSEALCTLICSNPDHYGTRVREIGMSTCARKPTASQYTCGAQQP
jgi:hypothetical protein